MSEITIIDNEFITMSYLDDKRIIYHTIHKPIPDQQFKDALNAGVDVLEEYGACKWLADDRKNGPLSLEGMVKWGTENWNHRAIAAGWKYWANVVPEETTAAGSLIPVIKALADLGLRMTVFTDLEEAFQWLDSMEG